MVTQVSDTGVLPPVQSYLDWIATVRGADYVVDPSLDYGDLVNDFLHQKQAASLGKPYVGATLHRNFDRLRFLWPEVALQGWPALRVDIPPQGLEQSAEQLLTGRRVGQRQEGWQVDLGAHLPRRIGHDVDDTTHLLAISPLHRPSKDSPHCRTINNGNGRFCRRGWRFSCLGSSSWRSPDSSCFSG